MGSRYTFSHSFDSLQQLFEQVSILGVKQISQLTCRGGGGGKFVFISVTADCNQMGTHANNTRGTDGLNTCNSSKYTTDMSDVTTATQHDTTRHNTINTTQLTQHN